MLGKTANPLLQQTEQAIMQKMKPEFQEPLKRTVTAGLQVMYGSKNNMTVQQLSKSNDYAHNVGEGAAKLVGILFEQSKKTMPPEIAVAAATIFMCEGLDFLEQAGKIKVTPDLLAEATQDMGASVLQLFGVSQEKMQQMIAQKQGQGAPGSPPTGATPMAAPTPPAGIVQAAQGA
jgi:hypothetical protein